MSCPVSSAARYGCTALQGTPDRAFSRGVNSVLRNGAIKNFDAGEFIILMGPEHGHRCGVAQYLLFDLRYCRAAVGAASGGACLCHGAAADGLPDVDI